MSYDNRYWGTHFYRPASDPAATRRASSAPWARRTLRWKLFDKFPNRIRLQRPGQVRLDPIESLRYEW